MKRSIPESVPKDNLMFLSSTSIKNFASRRCIACRSAVRNSKKLGSCAASSTGSDFLGTDICVVCDAVYSFDGGNRSGFLSVCGGTTGDCVCGSEKIGRVSGLVGGGTNSGVGLADAGPSRDANSFRSDESLFEK